MKPTPKPTAATVARILKALPKTKDGVPMYPGMPVFLLNGDADGIDAYFVAELHERFFLLRDKRGTRYQFTRKPFSTRAAALAEVKRRNGGKR